MRENKNRNTSYPYFAGELGVDCQKERTRFRVWSPTADKIKVIIYSDDITPIYDIITDMKQESNGTWGCCIKENLSGKYYIYRVYIDNEVREVVDPYAKAVGVNSKRGLLFLPGEANPAGWCEDKRKDIDCLQDAIIYELHIRDFSYSSQSGIKNKLKYTAFTEKNTATPNGTPTGLSHLRELGITHVQLMPVFDFATVSDKCISDYNWGYDPYYYNVPEGSYASCPSNLSRIKELKSLIQSLHQEGLGVIMDVVYNHTYFSQDSPFNKLVPDYYYRKTEKGKWSNGSGCGNEIASEKPMVRKFIIDSIRYWVEEYHIDGFRFDLMGLMDRETAYLLREELDKYSPQVLMYGEPWAAAASPLSSSFRMIKGAQRDKRIGFFNDWYRNAIKGDNDGKGRGFVSGAAGQENEIKKGIVGEINYRENIIGFASEPDEVINYVSSHDNLTLWDKLKRSNSNTEKSKRIKMDLLAQAIFFTSQGGVFFQGGEEFLRTKYGWEDSYCAGDKVNCLKWERKDKYYSVFDYYQGLIKLRLEHPAFRMRSAAQIRDNLLFFNTPLHSVGYIIKGYVNGDPWRDIVVIHNGQFHTMTVQLPYKAEWEVVVSDHRAGTKPLYKLVTDEVKVSPLSTLVLHRV